MSIPGLQAQINDTDAKLQYQQAEKAYNNEDFSNAFKISDDLMKKMGKEEPKVIYLLLKSYDKSLTKGTSDKNYKDLDVYASLSTRFMDKINSTDFDYDASKAQEIKAIQQNLLKLKEQYAATKDRKPQDAIDFLNECAKKFPGNSFDRGTKTDNEYIDTYNRSMQRSSYRYNIMFELVDNYLIIRNNFFDGSRSTPETQKQIIFIDLSIITEPTRFTPTTKDYKPGEGVQTNYAMLYISGFDGIVRSPSYTEFSKKAIKLLQDTSIPATPQVAFQSWEHLSSTDILDNFDIMSKEFTDGKYAERINDALRFLINSVPKQKTEEKDKIKSKF